MKKQKITSLVFKKKTISALGTSFTLKGGAEDAPLTVKPVCKPQVPMSWIPRCHSKYSPCPML